MIKVVRIAGESFDLENQREMPKALILSNGEREYSLYVSDEDAKAVLEMMLELTPMVKLEKAPQEAASPKRQAAPARKPAPKKVEPAPVHTFEKPTPPQMAEVGGAAEEEEDENSGFEPGEEYNDPATGAESV